MTIKEKILSYLDYKGIKKSDFFDAMDIAPSNFKGAAKQSELGSDKVAKILATYTDLSAEWLLMNIGEMIKSPNSNTISYEQSIPMSIEDKLLTIIQEKDNVIREQAEEIGQLRERILQLQREKGKDASDAQTSGVANVG